MDQSTVRFLYIDDDPLSQKLFGCFVDARYGKEAHVENCSSIRNALELLKRAVFDYVFLDNRLGKTPNGQKNASLLRPHLNSASLFLTSASVDASCYFVEEDKTAIAVIDKFDLREFILNGKLEEAA